MSSKSNWGKMFVRSAIAASLFSPQTIRPVIATSRRRAWVATYICTAFVGNGEASDSIRRVHREAYDAMTALIGVTLPTKEDLADYRAEAQRVRDEVVRERSEASGAPVLIAVAQLLLCDAPQCCDRLNRAVIIAEGEHDSACSADDYVLAEKIADGVKP
jgi:hypothetical protein